MLWQIPPARLQDYHPTVKALRNSVLLAFNLVANGAFVPQMVQLENKTEYAIRLLPALISKEVKVLVEKLSETLPPDLFYCFGQKQTSLLKKMLQRHCFRYL